MAPSKEFMEIVDKMKEIHVQKNNDYATESDPLSNFKFAAELVKHFSNPTDQVFVSLIGIKLARLSVLLTSGKTPNNESIADSFIDLANYSALWGAARQEKDSSKILENAELKKEAKKVRPRRVPADFIIGYDKYNAPKAWLDGYDTALTPTVLENNG